MTYNKNHKEAFLDGSEELFQKKGKKVALFITASNSSIV